MKETHYPTVLNLGFRPFFLGAAIVATVSMSLWILVFTGYLTLEFDRLAGPQWHAHEMLYGYAMAVIAGFLLTAVRNWTGKETLRGWPLGMLVGLWLLARVSLWLGDSLVEFSAVMDLLFNLALVAAVCRPIIQVKQWRQLGIMIKLGLLFAGNLLFYLGVLLKHPDWIPISLYGALYLVVALILTIGRRVIPFFVRSALGVELANSRWLDAASLAGLLVFFISELVSPANVIGQVAALIVFLANASRLILWHKAPVWGRPMLWSLYIAFWCIALGFLMFALADILAFSRLLAVHALALGGIGLITVSMMGRVSIGHTGRDLSQPPPQYVLSLMFLLAGVVCRVLLPLMFPDWYLVWLKLSAALWIAGFTIFLTGYAGILTSPRVDGRHG
ncbi:hypothetical protein BTA51_16445 [Hahella sp. CCB-MM4]|uniref:NnrS family protein n=1 Tax=Hahella sp. (strain CCB-MM4) TaxID=1926491 RepID=UPI000B9B39CE|nr:NnrS family protein [Hahella sp. CCB-MM4]OZG72323.1 hypothetical protein BTA51_16445 [Hahella sp. CCB-MM4]